METDVKIENAVSTLTLPPASVLKQELALKDPTQVEVLPQEESELDARAVAFVDELLKIDPKDLEKSEQGKNTVEMMATDLQRKAAGQSQLLREPLKKLAEKSDDGGSVAKTLIDLKMQVEGLDPGKFDFGAGWFSRAVGMIPGVGTPMKRYFTKFESAQTVISAIVRSLEGGRDGLLRDNITLVEDQKMMRTSTHNLEKAIRLGMLIDQKLQYKMERELASDEEKKKFVGEELMFPLRQRIIDLQQQLAVNQQGVLAVEVIIRNNKELVRGVNRSLNVTVSALQVGATVAMALANQKIVLDKLEAVNKTTSDLISGTAARLKTQGVQIHQQASSAVLDMNSLKQAFADIETALSDISKYRNEALPKMASTIGELDEMSKKADATIKKMEKGNSQKPQIELKVDV